MNSLFSDAARLCAAGTPFVWASIIREDGSTPRSAGSKMIILPDGILGTIGGGTDSFLSKNKAKSADAKLAKWTKWVALVFMVLTLVLSFL